MKKVLGLALTLILLGAAPAAAHVSVSPTEVEEGGFTKLVFRVPNESDRASTVELEIVFPEAAPFSNARTKPIEGWTSEVVRDADRVVGIVWTGGAIGPAEFQEFEVSLGPVPEVDVLEFKALQTYDDGEIARWIDPVSGDEEAAFPAPTITVTSGGDGGEHGEPTASGPVSAAADVDPDDDAEHGTDPAVFAALLLGGLVLIGVVVLAIVTRNRLPR